MIIMSVFAIFASGCLAFATAFTTARRRMVAGGNTRPDDGPDGLIPLFFGWMAAIPVWLIAWYVSYWNWQWLCGVLILAVPAVPAVYVSVKFGYWCLCMFIDICSSK